MVFDKAEKVLSTPVVASQPHECVDPVADCLTTDFLIAMWRTTAGLLIQLLDLEDALQ